MGMRSLDKQTEWNIRCIDIKSLTLYTNTQDKSTNLQRVICNPNHLVAKVCTSEDQWPVEGSGLCGLGHRFEIQGGRQLARHQNDLKAATWTSLSE